MSTEHCSKEPVKGTTNCMFGDTGATKGTSIASIDKALNLPTSGHLCQWIGEGGTLQIEMHGQLAITQCQCTTQKKILYIYTTDGHPKHDVKEYTKHRRSRETISDQHSLQK